MKTQTIPTPGPWHVSDIDSCNEVIDSMGRTIAEVEEWNSEGRGNVTLLAAAHDLLKALEGMCIYYGYSNYMTRNLDAETSAEAVIIKARDAIKKATGEA